ncbi:importin-13 isoform X2 [Cephus cinctus]|uniref:Importin-13 isoform X2 n=1 Tax=Cephus cinctus TaxID=211228 RepID=A0AAJ7CE06_CEPCN|nr:importin-13 isoform X2 [Cephus cinctus]
MDYAATVEDAVKKFYSTGSHEAHSWLLQVQASREAWTFVWELLESSKSCEAQFFGATTLHSKISKQWNEIPTSEYSALRQRLLNCLKQPHTPKLVLSRLCQALAAFLANSHAVVDEDEDKNLVDELAEILPYDSPFTLDLLLRVLSTLPGEFQRRQGARRIKLRDGLMGSWSKITCLLQQVFSSCDQSFSADSSNTLYILALECAMAWLKMGQLPLETTGRIYPQLLTAASRFVPSREEPDEDSIRTWEVVQECVIAMVTHTELHKRPQLFWEWSRGLVFTAHETSGGYFAEILTALGDVHSRAFLLALTKDADEGQRWTSERFIELLLECSEQEGRYPIDEKTSCIPFGFWYALQDDLGTLDYPQDIQASHALKPIYARLAQALLRKASLPPSPSEAGDADDRELLRCYRQDAADTLAYCYNVLGSDLLVLLGQRLSQPHNELQKWTDVESTLHAFKALADNVSTEETQYVAALMNLILSHIPYSQYPDEVLAGACSALGAYAEWFGDHPEPWLAGALRLLALGLQHGSITALPASMALKDIAGECGPHMSPFVPSMLDIIEQALHTVSPGGGEGLRLMYAAGKLLNSLESTELQLCHLDATLGPCIMKLHELLQQPVSYARVAVVNQLKMTTMLFSTLEGSVGKVVLEGLLPLFTKIVSHPEWSRDDATLEAMHVCTQRSLSSLSHPEIDARPLLPILVTSYKTQPHPAALNLLRQLVLLFGKDTDNIVKPIFEELSGLTLNGVSACRSVGGNLSDLSDLLEAYMSLLAQICKKNSRMLLQIPDQISEMLRCGMACLLLPEAGTTKAAGSFLSHAIMQNPHLQTFIHPIGQELICVILRCVGGEVSSSNLEPHAQVLWALNKTCVEWTAQWLRLALADRSAPMVAEAQKEIFARNVLRERTNKLRIYELFKDFNLICRQHVIGL